MEQFFYMETGSTDPAYNLAFEEYVLTNRKDGSILILWQNDNTIVVGRNQNTEAEINRGFVEKNGIRVVRRITGGGAVYHDMGNLNYSFITDTGDVEIMVMSRFTEPVVAALKSLGLDVEASGRNDILVSGRKVSGTAQRLAGGRILHHGTLLFDSDPEKVSGALNPDPLKFTSKAAKSVKSRIGNIRDFLKKDMTLDEFKDHLRDFISGGAEVLRLSAEELSEVAKLKNERYDTWEWNYGRSPKFSFANRKKWPGGILEVRLEVKDGMIRDIAFFGDFLALRDLDEVCERFKGVRHERGAVSAALEGIGKSTDAYPDEKDPGNSDDMFDSYFGGITRAEVLDTMFAD